VSDSDPARGDASPGDITPRPSATRAPAPPLAPVLRYYGPWLAGALLVSAGALAYARLDARLDALESRPTATPAPTNAAAPIAPATPGNTAQPARAVQPAGNAQPPGTAPIQQVRAAAPPNWACDAQLDAEAVRGVIGRDGRAVLACIAASRAQTPTLSGRLDVRLRVGGEGRVEAVHVGGVADDALVACVGRAALAWTFPAPGAGRCAVVAAPFLVGP